MIPATEEDKDLFVSTVQRAPFASSLVNAIVPSASDPVPGIDRDGRRRADGWTVVFDGTVAKDWCNIVHSMHGAAAAWIVDTCSSAALIVLSTPTFWGPPMLGGVSLTLDMTYYHPAPVGTRLRITVVVDRMNLTLANIRCDITDWESGKKYASGQHVKIWRAAAGKAKL